MDRREAGKNNGSRWFQMQLPLSEPGESEIIPGAMIWTAPLDPDFGTGAFDGVIMMTFVKTFLRDESGASAAEYALILAIVGAGIALATNTLGTAISTAINDSATCIDTNGGTCN